MYYLLKMYLKFERRDNRKYAHSKQIIKSIAILIIFIKFFFIKNYGELKINNNSPLLPSKFKCSNNIKSLIFKIRNKTSINLLNYKTLYSKNLISSIFGNNFSFFGIHNSSREKTLVKLGFNKKTNMGVYNLYVIPLYNNNWKNNITHYIISKYQKINRYLNCEEYATKSGLYLNYKEMKKLFPSDYNYMAETYLYPEDKEEIILKFQNYKFENNFHGLITGIKPMKLYIYNEGFVKISSVKYNFSNLENKFSFITNVGFQKKSGKYKYPKAKEEIEDSNLWNLSILKEYYSKNGFDYDKLFEEVKDIFIKMVFSIRKKLIESIEKNNLKNSNFYHLLGFDILLDNNLNPILLDVNKYGALHNDNASENTYIYNLIIDTLNLIGITSIEENNDHITPKEDFKNELEYNLCELEKPRGGYILIFPLKKNIEKYKKLYLNQIPLEDLEFWKYL